MNQMKAEKRILVDEATGDTEKLQIDQIRLQRLKQEYNRFSKATGLRTQPERAQVSGFGVKQAAQTRKKGESFTKKRKDAILNDTEITLIPITRKNVQKVQAFSCNTLTPEFQKKLKNEHKRLLLSLSNKPLGTEGAATYTLEMKQLGKIQFGESGESSVSIPK